uniref:C2H2-type domain-containing protein n=1 Tax=Acanthochromis polyacanthus TaxID=80966 RepID=A0A3Q1EM28_9TELE
PTMGEVTVKLEEVVMKQEASLDPLPEPLLIILSPPPAFLPVPGEPTMLWPKWLKAFEHYLEALGEKELVDSSKCMLLQNCLGPEGQTHKSQVLSCPDCNEKFTNSDVFSCHIKSHSENQSSQTEAQSSQQADGSEVKSNDANDDAISGNGNSPEKEINLVTEDKNPIEGKSQVGGRKKEKVTCKTKTKGHFCPICVGKRFRGKFKKQRPYSCTRCDYAFCTLVELTEHMSSHEGEPPLTCPDCGRTFLNKNKLEKHLTIHTGERPHLCSICGNGFPSAASLKLHINIHTGEKPFQCSQCNKSFSYGRMTELKMHQRYHTGDKPYAFIKSLG